MDRLPDAFLLGFWLAAAASLAGALVMVVVRVRQSWAARRHDEACLLAGAGLMLFALVIVAALLPFNPAGTAG